MKKPPMRSGKFPFSQGAVQRRFSGGAKGAAEERNESPAVRKSESQGAPGVRGGEIELSPNNVKPAGPMLKKNPKAGKMMKPLFNLPTPR